LLLAKEIRNDLRGSVFEMTDHDFEPLMQLKDKLILKESGLIITACPDAVKVLMETIPFVKLQAKKGPNHIFKVLDYYHEGFHALWGTELTNIVVYRKVGGWGDVQMVLSTIIHAKKEFPDLAYHFSAPGPLHELGFNNPYLASVTPFHQFKDIKHRMDAASDLTRPCIRYEIHNQPGEVTRNRIDTFAAELRMEKEIKIATGFYLGEEEAGSLGEWRDVSQPLIGLCIKSHAPVRDWHIERFKALAQMLKKHGRVLIVHNRESDLEGFEEFENTLSHSPRETALKLNECDLVIGVDTGPMHTAAVLRVPTLWLFTHIKGDIRTRNYPEAQVIQHSEVCPHSPCWYDIKCGGEKTQMPACAKAITPEEVYSRALEMLDEKFLSWVIVGWEKLHLTQECLEYVRRAKKWSHEIILIDNGSGNAVRSWAEKQSDIIFHRLDSNLGCVIGRDHGMRLATGRYLITLDNDQFIGPRFLNQILQEPTDVVGVEAWSMNRKGYAFRVEESKKPMYYVGGGGCLFSREAAEKIDFLDKEFAPAWFSDVDFTRKLFNAGYSVSWVPNADVKHLGHRTVFAQESFNVKKAWAKSHKYFMNKWKKDLWKYGS
jgi:ADP-heptose:LPS heptosyltransferase